MGMLGRLKGSLNPKQMEQPESISDSSATPNMFNGKRVALKGFFEYGTHEDVAERIESLGGRVGDGYVVEVFDTYNADYVIVGQKSRAGAEEWNPLEKKKYYEEMNRESGHDAVILLEYEVDALRGHAVMTSEKMNEKRKAEERKQQQHDSINDFRALAYKVVEDGAITIDEVFQLKRAFNNDDALKSDPAMRPVWLQIYKLKKTSVLSEEQESQLIDSLHRIIDPTWCTDGEIIDEISGKTFCLTGDFEYGSRSKVSKQLVSLGGVEKKSVTQDLDYLIVGSLGNNDYAYGNYGSKVKKAIENQNKGSAVKIIPEREFGPLRE